MIWKPVLSARQRDALIPSLLEAAARITDSAGLDALLAARAGPWRSASVADGDAGLSLLCGQLDRCFPGRHWGGAARRFLSLAVRAAETDAPPGLFAGVSGLVFVAHSLGRDGDLATPAARAAATARGTDLVSGLSGVGVALLSLDRRQELRAILARLVAELPTLRSPGADLGLAHGVPGPLALLALALRAGVEVVGQRDALADGCAWLLDQQAADKAWPPFADDTSTARTAWCYGSPGVARTLWLAGAALGDPALRTNAVDAMLAVYARPPARRGLHSPMLCHGVAGLLQVTLRFAHDTGEAPFVDAARALAGQIGSDLGDDPRLLEGSAGVILALLAASTGVEPTWDRLFLLS